MHTTTSTAQKTFGATSNCPLFSWKSFSRALFVFLLFSGNTLRAQTATCSGATLLTTVNSSSCTAGTAFNISTNTTGTPYATCATGRADATNGWGRFVSNGTEASITYDPPNNRNAMIFVYSGTCGGTLTQIGCVNSGGNGVTETLNLTGLTPGATYYVRIVRYNSTGAMNGDICVASPYSITTQPFAGTFCGGSGVSVDFTSYGTYSGNMYRAQLSNAAGSFASPTSIGTLTSDANSGTIAATLPANVSGAGYRIRVISNGPAVTGSNNGSDLVMNPAPQGSFAGNTICGSGVGELTFTATSGSGPFTVVYNDGISDRTATGVASGSPFLPFTAPLSTTNYTLVSVTDDNGCIRSTGFTDGDATITFGTIPTITASSSASSLCASSSAQNSSLSYSASSGMPTQYAITWDAPALTAGLVNLNNTSITASPLNVPVAGNVAGGVYTGSLTVTNADGCASTGSPFSLTIHAAPTITTSPTAGGLCFSSGSQNSTLAFSATSGSPDHYSINWDAAALTAGMTNVSSTNFTGSPITFPVAAGVPGGVYSGTLLVTNGLGCSSAGNVVTITITNLPTITSNATATPRCYSASAQNSSLIYSASTGSPTLYRIAWDAAALSAGLINTGLTSLPASPLPVPIAAGVPAGTYNGSLWVVNGAGCESATGNSFTLTISNTYPVMTSAASASVCSGSTVNIPLTSSIPSNYTWFAWSNANVSGESTTPQSTGTLSNTLTLTTASTQIVNYLVTPTSTGGCTGASQAVAITVNLLPTITSAPTAAARCYSASAQNSTLSYSAVTQSPTHYTITWNAAAQTAGFINVPSTVLPTGTITFPVPAGVAAGTYTGTVRVTNANGCSSTGNNFTVTISTAPIINTQPTNQTVCSGSSISFSVAASGVALTYQWRRGTTNLCNCGVVSGVNTNTLTINPAAVGNAAADYNCVITSGACPGVISNYVSLTVNTAVAVPSAQATDLIFPAVGITSIIGTFTKSSSASHYLVVRTPTASAPTNPTNGTTYTQGTSALGGYIQYVGTGNVFTATGLSQGTTYYFWVFAYNSSSCGTSPLYRTGSPLNGNATTATNVSCGTVTTLYWGGAGSVLSGATSGTDFNTASNWSTSSSSYVASPVAPSQCNTVSMAINSNSTLTLSADASVYNLTYTINGNNRSTRLSTEGNTLTVNGDAVVDVAGGNQNTAIYIGENSSGSGVVDFKANFKIGETYYSGGFFTAIPQSYLIGNINSKIIFRGDVLFGRTARVIQPAGGSYPPPNPVPVPGTGTTPGTIEFDGPGLQQVLWNNNYYYDNFYNIVVGNQNTPYVKHVTGTYTPDNIFNNFTINDGCTVDLGTSQWIREYQGGTLTMNGTAKLILGNDESVLSSYSTGVTVAGSNFPGGFSTMNISPSSTIEYNGGNSITQTVLGVPAVGSLTYGNLVLSNTDGMGTANKISTSVITVAGNTSINDKTNFTLGANLVSGGSTTVNNEGSMDCNTRVVSGTGSFALSGGGTLSMGSPAGITASGAAGNIQTSSRSFSTSGNYVYNGTTAQATGNGLPKTVNNLTISNAAGVTLFAASANYSVTGTLRLATGAFAINGDTLTINSIQRTSGTLTGSSTSSIGITGSSVPLFFTGGGRTLKHLFLSSSASADLQTTLDITAGSNAGSVAVASGATLNTYGYLTLKSDANGTARVAEIPVDGSGNALGTISGNVQIERYIPAKRGWRMLTLPVSASGAPTINDALQEGAVNTTLAYVNNQNPNPGYGIHISGSSSSLGFDATPLNNPSMLRFTRATGLWSGIPNTLTSTVRDYEGYMVFIRGNRSVNLNLNTGAALSNTVIRVLGGLRMGRQTINLPGGAGTYSVAGNPFASTIDFRSISTTGAASSSTFVLWDPALTGSFGVGAYQYFTQSGGPGSDYTVFPGGGSYGSAGSVSNHVQAGQAFMVQHSGAGTVVINENAKVSSSTSTVFRPMPNNTTGRISTLLSAVEADSSTTLLDGALVLYSHLFSDSLDVEDAKKLMNSSENFGINTGTSIYQIEKRRTINDTDTIQYDIRSMKIKKYQLAVEVQHLEEAGTSAFLEDSYTRTVTALDFNATTVYPFSVTADAASKAANRFKIYFKQLTVLPVTFTSVKAYRKNKTINVEWKVTAQTNISSYEVERSADGILFTNQHSLPAAIDNNSNNSYQWTDEEPLSGLNFFRIKSVESNGRATYSNIVKVFFGKDPSPITIFPNPVTDGRVNISFAAHQPGIYTARLFNSTGQLMKSVNLQLAATNGNAVFHFDKNITRGNYILEIVQPDNTTTHIKLVY